MTPACDECIATATAGSIAIIYGLSGAWGITGSLVGIVFALYSECTAKAVARVVDATPIPKPGTCYVTFEYLAEYRGVGEMPCPTSDSVEICYCARRPSQYAANTKGYFPARAADAMWVSGLACAAFFLVVTMCVCVQKRRREVDYTAALCGETPSRV